MDYNFNLKHESQNKFKMSPFLQPSGFERCFSTSNGLSVAPCGAGNLAMNPLKLVNFISGLHNKSPKNPNCKIPETPMMQYSDGVSVSCFVSGFVGAENHPQTTQKYCNGLLLDVLLNEINTIEKAAPSTHSCTANLSCTRPDVTMKRTYAEVAKEKPKPPGVKYNQKNATVCDNFTRLQSNNAYTVLAAKEDNFGNKLVDTVKPNTRKVRQQSYSSSSESSLDSGRKNRTLSECSVDSDDSFIVFENDVDDAEDASSDSSEEEILGSIIVIPNCQGKKFCEARPSNNLPKCQGKKFNGTSSSHNLPNCQGKTLAKTSSNKSNKKVTFKTDEELVTVHIFEDSEYGDRAGLWEQYARDRVRFHNRIQNLSSVISPVLSAVHREDIYRNRFMTT